MIGLGRAALALGLRVDVDRDEWHESQMKTLRPARGPIRGTRVVVTQANGRHGEVYLTFSGASAGVVARPARMMRAAQDFAVQFNAEATRLEQTPPLSGGSAPRQ